MMITSGFQQPESMTMPLTRPFADSVQARIRADPAFRHAMIKEARAAVADGDVELATAILRHLTAAAANEGEALPRAADHRTCPNDD